MPPLDTPLDFRKPVLTMARELLYNDLVKEEAGKTIRLTIVETEAYCEDDPASHSYNGQTPRSEVMFGPPAHWYVYKCYGIHWMLNAVCGEKGRGEAVLIRAAEPVKGEDVVRDRRGVSGEEITNGPGKLAEALGVDGDDDGAEISPSSGLYVVKTDRDGPIYESPRVGINEATERSWRFFTESDYVSKVSQNDIARRRD
ncbi:MAG: DNA-3-methyladenine glycosylase [bacterium]